MATKPIEMLFKLVTAMLAVHGCGGSSVPPPVVDCSFGAIRCNSTDGIIAGINNVQFTGTLAPGNNAVLTFDCQLSGKRDIKAGNLLWTSWEGGAQHFQHHWHSPYFYCDTHQCFPAQPIALTIHDPDNATSLCSVNVTVPLFNRTAQNVFYYDFFGDDQAHLEDNFAVSLAFSYPDEEEEEDAGRSDASGTEEAVSKATGAVAPPAPLKASPVSCSTDKYLCNSTDGYIGNIHNVKFSTLDGTFTPGTDATLTFDGQLQGRLITDGNTQWKSWEGGAEHFEHHYFGLYFYCDNKQCYPNQPITLTLDDPSNSTSLCHVNISVPLFNRTAQGIFYYNFHGDDQEHLVDDFSISISYTL